MSRSGKLGNERFWGADSVVLGSPSAGAPAHPPGRKAVVRLSAVEVKLGKRTLEDVGESSMGIAWVAPDPLAPGLPASGEHEEEWVDIVVGVELQPWPDRTWLTFWQEEDFHWPDRFDLPVLDGRKLIFEARENELEEAWAAVKARVEATNQLYREEFTTPKREPDSDPAEQESLARLREAVQTRIDALE
jgi:hypothetical protein